VAIGRLGFIGEISQLAGPEYHRISLESTLSSMGFVPHDGRQLRNGQREILFRAYQKPLAPIGDSHTNEGLSVATFLENNYVFAVILHGRSTQNPTETAGSDEALPKLEKVLRSVVCNPLLFSEALNPRPTGAERPTSTDAVSHIVSTSMTVSQNILRLAAFDSRGRPIVWRGNAIDVTILDARDAVRSRTTVYDSWTLSLLGPGIELPSGAKRLELRSRAGNLFRADVPAPGP